MKGIFTNAYASTRYRPIPELLFETRYGTSESVLTDPDSIWTIVDGSEQCSLDLEACCNGFSIVAFRNHGDIILCHRNVTLHAFQPVACNADYHATNAPHALLHCRSEIIYDSLFMQVHNQKALGSYQGLV